LLIRLEEDNGACLLTIGYRGTEVETLDFLGKVQGRHYDEKEVMERRDGDEGESKE
jgi:hypothetical protein